jgi:hypothetical protein
MSKGTYSYHGDTGSNLSLSGAGNEILSITKNVGATVDEVEWDSKYGGLYAIAIKNVSSATVAIQAKSVVGDDFSKGSYTHGNTALYLEITPGDIIHGKFDKISLEEPSSGTSSIKIIKGGKNGS